jgi:hypothetical protein
MILFVHLGVGNHQRGLSCITADIACSATRELSPSVTSARTAGRQVRSPASRSSAGRSGRDEHRCVMVNVVQRLRSAQPVYPMPIWSDVRCSSQVTRTTGPPCRRSRADRLREPARRCGIWGEPTHTPRGRDTTSSPDPRGRLLPARLVGRHVHDQSAWHICERPVWVGRGHRGDRHRRL